MSFDISLLQPKERRKEIFSEVGRKYQYDEKNINGIFGDASMHDNVLYFLPTSAGISMYFYHAVKCQMKVSTLLAGIPLIWVATAN